MSRSMILRNGCLATIAILGTGALTGCYSETSLIAAIVDEKVGAAMKEIEIGTFRTTLTRDPSNGTSTEVRLRVFGWARTYRAEEVEQLLADHDDVIRHAITISLRMVTPDELVEEDLDSLRQRFVDVINASVPDNHLEGVGFADIAFTPM